VKVPDPDSNPAVYERHREKDMKMYMSLYMYGAVRTVYVYYTLNLNLLSCGEVTVTTLLRYATRYLLS
jgi:hypothetical protein